MTDFKDTLAKFIYSQFQEKGKFPSQPQQNLKGQYNSNASSSRNQHMDQVKSITSLRSGKVIEKPILEPYLSLRVRNGLNLNIAQKRLIPHQYFHFLMP